WIVAAVAHRARGLRRAVGDTQRVVHHAHPTCRAIGVVETGAGRVVRAAVEELGTDAVLRFAIGSAVEEPDRLEVLAVGPRHADRKVDIAVAIGVVEGARVAGIASRKGDLIPVPLGPEIENTGSR